MSPHRFKGCWIRAELPSSAAENIAPAPILRGSFSLSRPVRQAALYLCTPGFHEVYINGVRVGDRVLTPAPMQFDRHVPYLRYDAAPLLRRGENTVEVLLGNGWFNSFTACAWNFEHAVWRDHPKLLADLVVDGITLLSSGPGWSFRPSAITFNALRNGEFYDARLEGETGWQPALPAVPPPGLPQEEEQEPCKVMRDIPPMSRTDAGNGILRFDFGVNFTGWVRIAVRGSAGGTVTLRYCERLHPDGSPDCENNAKHISSGEFQTDRYTLSGAPEGESWEPRFTYHGFQYVKAELSGGAELREITGRFVHTAFPVAGSFECGNDTLNALQRATVQSYLSNFTGLPTDCPQREKNGWTADAQLAMETGLWNFDAQNGYIQFLQAVADTQRPGGGICSIAPSPGWGYGVNPAWDFVLFEIPYQLWLFRGDDTALRRFYPNLKRYLEGCRSCSADHLLDLGLGDWCPPEWGRMAPRKLTSTAFYCEMARRMALFARILGKSGDEKRYSRLAGEVRSAFHTAFRNPDGTVGDGCLTSTAAALYFHLTDTPEADLGHLVKLLRENNHKADFGILGAKFVPRVLAEANQIDDALRIFTQEEYPGWAHWLRQGATTLWEHWKGGSSRNHIMFGDVSAWAYQYLGGIAPDIDAPGFRHFFLKPQVPEEVDRVDCVYRSAAGRIVSRWKKLPGRGAVEFTFEVPRGSTATLRLPGGETEEISSGRYVRLAESSYGGGCGLRGGRGI